MPLLHQSWSTGWIEKGILTNNGYSELVVKCLLVHFCNIIITNNQCMIQNGWQDNIFKVVSVLLKQKLLIQNV